MHRWRVKKKRETAHKTNMLEQEKNMLDMKIEFG